MSPEAIMRQHIRENLTLIRDDHVHGASMIARQAAMMLWRVCLLHLLEEVNAAEVLGELRATCRTLAHLRPSMAPLVQLASAVMLAAQRDDPAEALRAAAELVRNGGPMLRYNREIVPHLAERLGQQARVVTLSHSATVIDALTACRKHLAAVTFLESRPGGEGLAAAQQFKWRIDGWPDVPSLTLMADAASALAVAQASCVVVGADALLAGGFAINKVGTLPLALAAHAVGVPVFVLADTTKIAPASWEWHAEAFDPSLLVPEPCLGLSVDATVFERVPLALVTVLCQTGELAHREISAQAQALDGGYQMLAPPPTPVPSEAGEGEINR